MTRDDHGRFVITMNNRCEKINAKTVLKKLIITKTNGIIYATEAYKTSDQYFGRKHFQVKNTFLKIFTFRLKQLQIIFFSTHSLYT